MNTLNVYQLECHEDPAFNFSAIIQKLYRRSRNCLHGSTLGANVKLLSMIGKDHENAKNILNKYGVETYL